MSTNRTSGSARSTGRSGSARSGTRNNSEQSKNKRLELKFHTSTSGGNKNKYANYTAVKDSIVIKMQKTLHSEVIKSIRDEVLFDMNKEKPKRQWSKSSDNVIKSREDEQFADEFRIEFEMWAVELKDFKRDLKKAYAYIYMSNAQRQ